MGELIPIFGILGGALMTAGLVFGVVKIMQGPVGIALGKRIHGAAGDEDLRTDVSLLREQVDHLQQELSETQERLDFAERLLSQSKGHPELTGGDA